MAQKKLDETPVQNEEEETEEGTMATVTKLSKVFAHAVISGLGLAVGQYLGNKAFGGSRQTLSTNENNVIALNKKVG